MKIRFSVSWISNIARSRVSNMVVWVVPWRQPLVVSARNGNSLAAEITFRATYTVSMV